MERGDEKIDKGEYRTVIFEIGSAACWYNKNIYIYIIKRNIYRNISARITPEKL